MPSAVPYTPRPFVPDRFESRGRLGDYARANGRDVAEAMRHQGATSAALWSGIGQNVAGSLRDIAAYPEQQRQAAMLAQQQQRQEQAYQAAQQKEQEHAAKAERLKVLLAANPGQRPPPQAILEAVGPEDARGVSQMLDELFPKVEPEKPVVVGGRLVKPSDGSVVYEPPAEPQKPINVGGRLVDPVTFKPVYEPPAEPVRPVAVPDGGRLVNPQTGAVVYSAPPKATEPKAPPKLPAAMATTVAAAQTSLSGLDQLEGMFKPEYVGPVAGRYNEKERNAPSVPGMNLLPDAPEGFEDFLAETSALKNRVIQAITGAAVGVQEQARIMGEIPNHTDQPSVWKAKAKATRRNLQELMTNQIRMGTGSDEPLQPGATVQLNAPSAGAFRVGPYTVRVKQ